MTKGEKRPKTEPDYARGLDKEEEAPVRRKPDFARGLRHTPTSGDKYDTDYARGLDRGDDHERHPDYARGLADDEDR
jgi:hypothetical protein